MPLTAEATALLEQMAQANLPDLESLPPVAEFDPLRAQGEAYAQKLAAAGVGARSERYAGMFHPFSTLHKALPQVMRSIESAATFARQHMGG